MEKKDLIIYQEEEEEEVVQIARRIEYRSIEDSTVG
jgi:hypothetical protein